MRFLNDVVLVRFQCRNNEIRFEFEFELLKKQKCFPIDQINVIF